MAPCSLPHVCQHLGINCLVCLRSFCTFLLTIFTATYFRICKQLPFSRIRASYHFHIVYYFLLRSKQEINNQLTSLFIHCFIRPCISSTYRIISLIAAPENECLDLKYFAHSYCYDSAQKNYAFWTRYKLLYIIWLLWNVNRQLICWWRGIRGTRAEGWFFLGALIQLRTATIRFVMSVRPFAWKNWAPTWSIFIEYDNRVFL